ncbi:ExbD/TolR family protein [Nitrincola tapanii]|uniref:Biopolymer transporter ExbD n=1 Tax=Nitrincola tapanii TaxID=1708751 RepID=A0A5A9W415_9GAMM|nr:biopolymer transporter ExbD [Nitrincola tapanii]KAA0875362.1 biopolymer transporter ExbD [Nitrincola tapanii]
MAFMSPKPSRSNSEDNLIPLINVVFLMLIFFMLAGQIMASDLFKVTPPEAMSPRPMETTDLELLMNSEGELAFQGQLIQLEALAEMVTHALDPLPYEANAPSITFSLKIDEQVTTAQLRPVLQALRSTPLSDIQLMTRQGAL